MYLFPYCITWVVCEDYLTCDIAFNAVMPLSRASTRGRYSRIEGVTDWVHNLRIIFIVAQKNYVLEAPLGARPAADATDDVKNVWQSKADH